MKKFVFVLVALMAMPCLAGIALAHGEERGTSAITLKGKSVTVEYGRPLLNGRTTDALLGRVQPGGLWRVGANQSTTFKNDVDLQFGDVTIPAGIYSIWMQLQADHSWKLLFDTKHGQWGEPTPSPAECFASAALTASKPSSSAETLTLTLRKAGDGGSLVIHWGTLEQVATFVVK